MRKRESRASHWDEVYSTHPIETVSWYEREPSTSLELVELLAVPRDAGVIDVGGGASHLVDRLVDRGWRDVTVLDVSAEAMRGAKARLTDREQVTWVCADVLEWAPDRGYGLWHDRAVFHFLVDLDDRVSYLERLRAAVAPSGAVVIATFAPDGPDRCSGLPVVRYSADDLAELLAACGFAIVGSRREEHVTPAGVVQPFVYLAARAGDREGSSAPPGERLAP